MLFRPSIFKFVSVCWGQQSLKHIDSPTSEPTDLRFSAIVGDIMPIIICVRGWLERVSNDIGDVDKKLLCCPM
jgi:hypothetical protein